MLAASDEVVWRISRIARKTMFLYLTAAFLVGKKKKVRLRQPPQDISQNKRREEQYQSPIHALAMTACLALLRAFFSVFVNNVIFPVLFFNVKEPSRIKALVLNFLYRQCYVKHPNIILE